MNLSNIKPAQGSTHSEKRIGRGQGSGYGGTSTRGHKGAQSRSGYKHKRGFQGGQMPLQRRLPKFGFTNINKVVFKTVNLGAIETLVEKSGATAVGPAEMYAAGLIAKNDVVKVLGTGTLTKKVDVTANAFSKSAQAAIEAQGGTATKL
ncbi:50S ribosomal protein L15 [uncultured Rikenella sp.]|uniref:50S ribosomal protein L15 n=1 Tax=uncultured Rikenella sp. TaxID=368003 RepID=UPI00261B4CC0|nr:50S ribosomal protein L15 [uncultured Rikenella sp.]